MTSASPMVTCSDCGAALRSGRPYKQQHADGSADVGPIERDGETMHTAQRCIANLKAKIPPEVRAIEGAGFRVSPNILGVPTLWCKECGRDSGFHWSHCSKSDRKDP